MIHAWLPQGIKAAHPMIADQHILQCKGKGMSHMQRAGYIRRRHHYGVGCFLRAWITRKNAAVFTFFVPVAFT